MVMVKCKMGYIIFLMVYLTISFVSNTPIKAQEFDGIGQIPEDYRKSRGKSLLNSYEEVKDFWWNHLNTLPHLDSKEYIHKLVDFINDEDSKISYCLIVGGAKDIGKTTGIIFVSEAATRLGHDVFHLNLKTIGDMLDVGEVLRDFSWDVMEAIHNMNDVGKLKCVYNNMMKCRKIKQSRKMWYIFILFFVGLFLIVPQ